MFNKEKFITVEMYGFDGQAHQAKIKIEQVIKEIDPTAQALVLDFKVNPTDLNNESKEYIKIISSNRRIALKIFGKLTVSEMFKACYFGILPYHDIFCPSEEK